MTRWTTALAALCLGMSLWGCQGTAATPASPTAAPAPAAVEDQSWFTYFAPDGSYSVQFPKAPESVGNNPQARLLAHGLDKKGSNLSLIQMTLPPEMSAETVIKDPQKFFAQKGLKIVHTENSEWAGHKGIKLEMESQGNRIWVHMIFARPWLYQLVALQSSQSTEDFGPQRSQFFASFQFTQKK